MKERDYVRIKNEAGWCCIGKIVNINEFREPSMKYGVEASYLKDIMFIGDEDIIKSSPNIIDLIEVGDYVNGQLVKHIAYFEGVEAPIKKLIFADEYHLIPTEVCEQNEIKSIVTREMFESMEYKVGE